jgi:ABC-type Fe3+ transport system substrate-binding protein
LQESTYITSGNGTVVVLKNPPHPNAVKVYLDYLLSHEGQLSWSKASGFPSLRQDVPRDHVLPILIPKEGVKYQENYTERYVRVREEVMSFLKGITPP